MGAGETLLREGIPYFRIRVAGAPFIFLFYASVGFFRGIQNTRTPMLVAFLMSATNLVLDYALIYGNYGLPQLGLRGAAVAAWIAQFVGASSCLAFFFFSPATVSYRPSGWRVQLASARPLFRIGRDLAVRTGGLRFSLVFATGTVARMGPNTLAAHEIAFQLFMLGSDVIDGLAVAGQALAAKYLGSNQKDAAYRMENLITCGVVAGCLFAGAFLAFRNRSSTLSPQFSVMVTLAAASVVPLLLQPMNGLLLYSTACSSAPMTPVFMRATPSAPRKSSCLYLARPVGVGPRERRFDRWAPWLAVWAPTPIDLFRRWLVAVKSQ
jgi:MATE family multidrug resistance protein